MRLATIISLTTVLLAAGSVEADAYRRYDRRPFVGGVVRSGARYIGRGYSRYSLQRDFAANGYGGYGSYANWRLYRNRTVTVDPYSYGRCYWRGYYRPYLYCRKYTPQYSYYQSGTRAPYPGGYEATRYGLGYARPIGFGYGGGYRQPLYGSRYGYRYPHTVYPGGAGPYGFYDPFGYRLLPAFNFAPILTRLTTVFTIDGPEFDGESEAAEAADGLPQPRTKPVGDRFLTEVK